MPGGDCQRLPDGGMNDQIDRRSPLRIGVVYDFRSRPVNSGSSFFQTCWPGWMVGIRSHRGRTKLDVAADNRLLQRPAVLKDLIDAASLLVIHRAGRSRTKTPSPRLTARPANSTTRDSLRIPRTWPEQHAALRRASRRARASCGRSRRASRARSRGRTTAPSPRRRGARIAIGSPARAASIAWR